MLAVGVAWNGRAVGERAVRHEQMAYLRYFCSHQMDEVRFLQEEAAELEVHVEQLQFGAIIYGSS